MKKSSGFDTFIDNKFIPLERNYKLIIGVLLLILPMVIYFFAMYKPKNVEIQGLISKKTALQKEVKEAKTVAADLPRHQAEMMAVQERFNEVSKVLPKEKEIPRLLTDISDLGRATGLEFLTFKPQPDVPKNYFSEIPVQIQLRGPYHNMGSFLDRVSKMDRTVSVSNIKMATPKKVDGEILLNSSCRLVTYVFTNKKLEPQTNKK